MKYTPHDYQKRAEDYIVTHPIAAVFLSMGLGKTVITLSAINRLLFNTFEVFKVLVIAPLRVARDTWKEEIEKWDHLNAIRYSIAVGSERERLDALKRDADIYIINRENVEWLVDKAHIPFDFDMIVIDELSSFKSGRAKRFKALLKVRPRLKRIVGLTGTPASNGLIDLWAEFRILDMGQRLGRFITGFRNEYFTPDKRNQNIIFSYKLRPGAEEKIYKRIEDITLSMKALDYLEMPKLIENTVKIHMSPDEKSAYNELKQELVLELQGEEVAALSAASLASKLMQASSGAIYKDDGKYLSLHDRKLDALEERIEAAYGQSVLVAYWFRFDKERIENLLKRMKVTYAFLDTSDGIK